MHIYISAGESSGDLFGSLLAKELKIKKPDIHLSGLGTKKMAKEGVNLVHDMANLGVTGFVEVLGHLQEFVALKKKVLSHLAESKPDLVVFIDYPGFHFSIMKSVADLGIPITYYISPQVWAWHKRRIHAMRKYLSRF